MPILSCKKNIGPLELSFISKEIIRRNGSEAIKKNIEKFDCFIFIYHDQALIPIKSTDFYGSINFTAGLPFIRTSPDHGTGFDISGKGLAQSQSMVEAIKTAIDLTKDSRLFNPH